MKAVEPLNAYFDVIFKYKWDKEICLVYFIMFEY